MPLVVPSAPMASGVEVNGTEVHLCDNYVHLLVAAADLAGRKQSASIGRPLVMYIDDRLPLDEELRRRLGELASADIVRISDAGSVEDFAQLPTFLPGMLRRNLTWSNRRIVGPRSWESPEIAGRCFDVGYVYHPGFFLSKVVAGRCERVVMRDSGYANYVRHRVPWHRKLPRLLARRSPGYQVWGEEPWIDSIEVVRPDQLPERVQAKATRLDLGSLMDAVPDGRDLELARAFWGQAGAWVSRGRRTALILTQPIDELGICSAQQKAKIYDDIARRLIAAGFDIAVKDHPREVSNPVLTEMRHLPPAFPIEAWSWLGQPKFDLAVSLNSSALADHEIGFAGRGLQLIPPDRFYRNDWHMWPRFVNKAFVDAGIDGRGTSPETVE